MRAQTVPRLTQTHSQHQEDGCAAFGLAGGSQSSSWVCVAVLSRCGGSFAPPLPSRGYVEHLERGRLLQLSVSLQTVAQRMQFPGQFVKSPFKSFIIISVSSDTLILLYMSFLPLSTSSFSTLNIFKTVVLVSSLSGLPEECFSGDLSTFLNTRRQVQLH